MPVDAVLHVIGHVPLYYEIDEIQRQVNALKRNKKFESICIGLVCAGVCWGVQLSDQCVSVTNQMFAV